MDILIFLVVQIIGAAILSLIGALLVMVSTKMVAGFAPTYGNAYIASFFGYIASAVVSVILSIFTGSASPEEMMSPGSGLLLFVVAFIVQASVYARVIHSPEGHPISFGTALIIALVQTIVAFAIIFVIVVVFASLLVAGGAATGAI